MIASFVIIVLLVPHSVLSQTGAKCTTPASITVSAGCKTISYPPRDVCTTNDDSGQCNADTRCVYQPEYCRTPLEPVGFPLLGIASAMFGGFYAVEVVEVALSSDLTVSRDIYWKQAAAACVGEYQSVLTWANLTQAPNFLTTLFQLRGTKWEKQMYLDAKCDIAASQCTSVEQKTVPWSPEYALLAGGRVMLKKIVSGTSSSFQVKSETITDIASALCMRDGAASNWMDMSDNVTLLTPFQVRYYTAPLSYDVAKQVCEAQGASLAMLPTVASTTWLDSNWTSNRTIVGGSTWKTDLGWLTGGKVDGSNIVWDDWVAPKGKLPATAYAVAYATSDLQGATGDCIVVVEQTKLKRVDCATTQAPFICMRDKMMMPRDGSIRQFERTSCSGTKCPGTYFQINRPPVRDGEEVTFFPELSSTDVTATVTLTTTSLSYTKYRDAYAGADLSMYNEVKVTPSKVDVSGSVGTLSLKVRSSKPKSRIQEYWTFATPRLTFYWPVLRVKTIPSFIRVSENVTMTLCLDDGPPPSEGYKYKVTLSTNNTYVTTSGPSFEFTQAGCQNFSVRVGDSETYVNFTFTPSEETKANFGQIQEPFVIPIWDTNTLTITPEKADGTLEPVEVGRPIRMNFSLTFKPTRVARGDIKLLESIPFLSTKTVGTVSSSSVSLTTSDTFDGRNIRILEYAPTTTVTVEFPSFPRYTVIPYTIRWMRQKIDLMNTPDPANFVTNANSTFRFSVRGYLVTGLQITVALPPGYIPISSLQFIVPLVLTEGFRIPDSTFTVAFFTPSIATNDPIQLTVNASHFVENATVNVNMKDGVKITLATVPSTYSPRSVGSLQIELGELPDEGTPVRVLLSIDDGTMASWMPDTNQTLFFTKNNKTKTAVLSFISSPGALGNIVFKATVQSLKGETSNLKYSRISDLIVPIVYNSTPPVVPDYTQKHANNVVCTFATGGSAILDRSDMSIAECTAQCEIVTNCNFMVVTNSRICQLYESCALTTMFPGPDTGFTLSRDLDSVHATPTAFETTIGSVNWVPIVFKTSPRVTGTVEIRLFSDPPNIIFETPTKTFNGGENTTVRVRSITKGPYQIYAVVKGAKMDTGLKTNISVLVWDRGIITAEPSLREAYFGTANGFTISVSASQNPKVSGGTVTATFATNDTAVAINPPTATADATSSLTAQLTVKGLETPTVRYIRISCFLSGSAALEYDIKDPPFVVVMLPLMQVTSNYTGKESLLVGDSFPVRFTRPPPVAYGLSITMTVETCIKASKQSLTFGTELFEDVIFTGALAATCRVTFSMSIISNSSLYVAPSTMNDIAVGEASSITFPKPPPTTMFPYGANGIDVTFSTTVSPAGGRTNMVNVTTNCSDLVIRPSTFSFPAVVRFFRNSNITGFCQVVSTSIGTGALNVNPGSFVIEFVSLLKNIKLSTPNVCYSKRPCNVTVSLRNAVPTSTPVTVTIDDQNTAIFGTNNNTVEIPAYSVDGLSVTFIAKIVSGSVSLQATNPFDTTTSSESLNVVIVENTTVPVFPKFHQEYAAMNTSVVCVSKNPVLVSEDTTLEKCLDLCNESPKCNFMSVTNTFVCRLTEDCPTRESYPSASAFILGRDLEYITSKPSSITVVANDAAWTSIYMTAPPGVFGEIKVTANGISGLTYNGPIILRANETKAIEVKSVQLGNYDVQATVSGRGMYTSIKPTSIKVKVVESGMMSILVDRIEAFVGNENGVSLTVQTTIPPQRWDGMVNVTCTTNQSDVTISPTNTFVLNSSSTALKQVMKITRSNTVSDIAYVFVTCTTEGSSFSEYRFSGSPSYVITLLPLRKLSRVNVPSPLIMRETDRITINFARPDTGDYAYVTVTATMSPSCASIPGPVTFGSLTTVPMTITATKKTASCVMSFSLDGANKTVYVAPEPITDFTVESAAYAFIKGLPRFPNSMFPGPSNTVNVSATVVDLPVGDRQYIVSPFSNCSDLEFRPNPLYLPQNLSITSSGVRNAYCSITFTSIGNGTIKFENSKNPSYSVFVRALKPIALTGLAGLTYVGPENLRILTLAISEAVQPNLAVTVLVTVTPPTGCDVNATEVTFLPGGTLARNLSVVGLTAGLCTVSFALSPDRTTDTTFANFRQSKDFDYRALDKILWIAPAMSWVYMESLPTFSFSLTSPSSEVAVSGIGPEGVVSKYSSKASGARLIVDVTFARVQTKFLIFNFTGPTTFNVTSQQIAFEVRPKKKLVLLNFPTKIRAESGKPDIFNVTLSELPSMDSILVRPYLVIDSLNLQFQPPFLSFTSGDNLGIQDMSVRGIRAADRLDITWEITGLLSNEYDVLNTNLTVLPPFKNFEVNPADTGNREVQVTVTVDPVPLEGVTVVISSQSLTKGLPNIAFSSSNITKANYTEWTEPRLTFTAKLPNATGTFRFRVSITGPGAAEFAVTTTTTDFDWDNGIIATPAPKKRVEYKPELTTTGPPPNPLLVFNGFQQTYTISISDVPMQGDVTYTPKHNGTSAMDLLFSTSLIRFANGSTVKTADLVLFSPDETKSSQFITPKYFNVTLFNAMCPVDFVCPPINLGIVVIQPKLRITLIPQSSMLFLSNTMSIAVNVPSMQTYFRQAGSRLILQFSASGSKAVIFKPSSITIAPETVTQNMSLSVSIEMRVMDAAVIVIQADVLSTVNAYALVTEAISIDTYSPIELRILSNGDDVNTVTAYTNAVTNAKYTVALTINFYRAFPGTNVDVTFSAPADKVAFNPNRVTLQAIDSQGLPIEVKGLTEGLTTLSLQYKSNDAILSNVSKYFNLVQKFPVLVKRTKSLDIQAPVSISWVGDSTLSLFLNDTKFLSDTGITVTVELCGYQVNSLTVGYGETPGKRTLSVVPPPLMDAGLFRQCFLKVSVKGDPSISPVILDRVIDLTPKPYVTFDGSLKINPKLLRSTAFTYSISTTWMAIKPSVTVAVTADNVAQPDFIILSLQQSLYNRFKNFSLYVTWNRVSPSMFTFTIGPIPEFPFLEIPETFYFMTHPDQFTNATYPANKFEVYVLPDDVELVAQAFVSGVNSAVSAATIASAMANPASATSMNKITSVLRNARCPDIDVDDDGNMDWTENPLQVTILVGSMENDTSISVMDVAFIFLITFVHWAVAKVYSVMTEKDMFTAMGRVMYPSLSTFFCFFFYQTGIRTSLRVVIYGQIRVQQVACIVVFLVWLVVIPTCVYYINCTKFFKPYFAIDYNPKYSGLFSRGTWKCREDKTFISRFGTSFSCFYRGYTWFMLVDLGQAAALGILEGYNPDTYEECATRQAFVVAVFAVYASLLGYYRPYSGHFDNGVAILLTVMEGGAAFLIFMGQLNEDKTDKSIEFAILLLMVVGLVVFVKCVIELIMMIGEIIRGESEEDEDEQLNSHNNDDAIQEEMLPKSEKESCMTPTSHNMDSPMYGADFAARYHDDDHHDDNDGGEVMHRGGLTAASPPPHHPNHSEQPNPRSPPALLPNRKMRQRPPGATAVIRVTDDELRALAL